MAADDPDEPLPWWVKALLGVVLLTILFVLVIDLLVFFN